MREKGRGGLQVDSWVYMKFTVRGKTGTALLMALTGNETAYSTVLRNKGETRVRTMLEKIELVQD